MLRFRRKSSAKCRRSLTSMILPDPTRCRGCCPPFALKSSAEILARAADAHHAAGTRRVSATAMAPTSGRIVTQIQSDSSQADSPVRIRYAQPRSRPSLPASLASARFLPSPVGSDKMRNFLAEYPAWFDVYGAELDMETLVWARRAAHLHGAEQMQAARGSG